MCACVCVCVCVYLREREGGVPAKMTGEFMTPFDIPGAPPGSMVNREIDR